MIIKCKLKLILKPGKATPTPPIAPILGQYGLNLMNFCNKFNNLTKNINVEFIHVKIIVFQNLNYEIILGSESLSNVIKKIINVEKFSKKPGIEHIIINNFNFINIISKNRFLYEKKKISSIRKMILGTFYSLGIKYE
ncbi:hypothetical protein [Candidatus Carsonella ruddii]|uniref:Large ribosomal subunit protein uL11 n=1 Tax=Carsonella ruddii TaxID=114186 RepID=A0A1U9RS53_CARRU|nr:hypothetical protein [Candidatus Carsonella ruddii]AQU89599.1 LSU ribosomal protein L11p (L12e) [Candidatus Carsonella ruddii]